MARERLAMKVDPELTRFAITLALASPTLRREIIAALYEACARAGVPGHRS